MNASTPRDPLAAGLRLVWYGDTAVRVPHVCSCCMSHMARCIDLQLVTGDEESPDHVALPMPYCDACHVRARAWQSAQARGTWQALYLVFLPLMIAGFVLDCVIGFDSVGEGLAELGIELALALGATWFARGHFRAGPEQLPGHAPHCTAVESLPSDAFRDRGRDGGVVRFASWRFGLQWAELNGVAAPPQSTPALAASRPPA